MPQAVRTDDFIDTIGVCTKWSQKGTQWDNVQGAANALAYTKIRHVREGTIGATESTAAVNAGAYFNVVVYPGSATTPNPPSNEVPKVRALMERHPGRVLTVEGPNEVDLWGVNYNGATSSGSNAQPAINWQNDFYDLCKADSVVKNLPVLNFSWGVGPPTYAGKHDYGNIHAYCNDGDQPGVDIPWFYDHQRTVSALPKPMFLTETGYYTLPTDDNWGGVDERSQAVMSLNTIMRVDAIGLSRHFFYQLLDQYNDNRGREQYFGLVRYDFSYKPAATAIRNFITLLEDAGATKKTFTPASMTYTLGGTATRLGSKLMQKSNGNFYVVVWAEPDIWDQAANVAISRPITPITVTLDKAYPTLNVYDPLTGTTVTKTASSTGSIALDIRDRPLILEVVNTTSTPAPGTNSVTLGSGSDTLVLKVNQDAYQGNATYTVKVDGVQIGGTQTAAALRSSGQHDTITVLGNWAPGSHTVAITFIG